MSRSVLVVEDDPQNLYLMTYILEHAGDNVTSASDGEGAVALAASESFDFILMDILLPTLDGLEATRAIKQANPDAPPVIALTALSMKGDKERILRAGCDAYISKPVDPDTFLGEVEEILRVIGER